MLTFSCDFGLARHVFQWIPAEKTSPGSRLGVSLFALQGPTATAPSLLSLSPATTFQSMEYIPLALASAWEQFRHWRALCRQRLGRGMALGPGHHMLTALLFCLKKKGKKRKKKENHLQKKKKKNLKIKTTKNNPNQNQTKPPTQIHQIHFHKRWGTWISCLFPWWLGHTGEHGKTPLRTQTNSTLMDQGGGKEPTFWEEGNNGNLAQCC